MAQSLIYRKTPRVDADNLDREIQEIEKSFNTLSDFIVLSPTYAEPKKVVDFMVRFADGVNWNPRGLGKGVYMYFDGKWNKFNML